jgi:hypothetical protein
MKVAHCLFGRKHDLQSYPLEQKRRLKIERKKKIEYFGVCAYQMFKGSQSNNLLVKKFLSHRKNDKSTFKLVLW